MPVTEEAEHYLEVRRNTEGLQVCTLKRKPQFEEIPEEELNRFLQSWLDLADDRLVIFNGEADFDITDIWGYDLLALVMLTVALEDRSARIYLLYNEYGELRLVGSNLSIYALKSLLVAGLRKTACDTIDGSKAVVWNEFTRLKEAFGTLRNRLEVAPETLQSVTVWPGGGLRSSLVLSSDTP
jgi:hypothetical protein